MGGGSSRSTQRSSNSYETNNLNDQSYKDYSTTTNTVNNLDGGAIEEAFDFAKKNSNVLGEAIGQVLNSADKVGDNAVLTSQKALSYYDKMNAKSLEAVVSVAENSLAFANKATRSDSGQTSVEMTKYAMAGVGALALAMVLKK